MLHEVWFTNTTKIIRIKFLAGKSDIGPSLCSTSFGLVHSRVLMTTGKHSQTTNLRRGSRTFLNLEEIIYMTETINTLHTLVITLR